MQRSRPIQRHPHDTRLLSQRLKDCLANPPHRVRDELDSLGFVEFVRGADQTEIALVDQVGERHALILVLLRHRNHEAQIRTDQFVERILITDADSTRQFGFLFARDEGIDTDVAQVLVQRPFLVLRLLFRRSYSHGTSSSVRRGMRARKNRTFVCKQYVAQAVSHHRTTVPSRAHRIRVNHASDEMESGVKL